jgi:hypothetical protein
MATNRNRTFRKTMNDISANQIDFGLNVPLEEMIATEAGNAFKKPWHRLERGLRLNRLRMFVDDIATKRALKGEEKEALLQLLTKSLDKKLLNSKTAVEYDQEEQVIKEVKPLIMHQAANGTVLFQLLEKRNAITFRKRVTGGTTPSTTCEQG